MSPTLILRQFDWTRWFQWISLIGLAIAWLLLFIVSLTPLKSIYFVELATHVPSSPMSLNIGGSVRFGVLGYCYTGLEVSIPKFSHDGTEACSPRRLGYRIDSSVAEALHVDGLANAISNALSFGLALHFVDLILVLLTIATLLLPKRINQSLDRFWAPGANLAFFIASSLTFVLIVVTGIIDVVLVDGILHVVAHGILQGSSGSALWLIVVATVILFVVWVCAGVNMHYRKKIVKRCIEAHGPALEHVETRESTRTSDLRFWDASLLVEPRSVPTH